MAVALVVLPEVVDVRHDDSERGPAAPRALVLAHEAVLEQADDAEAGKGRADCIVVRNLPKSGKTPEDVLAYCHMSEADIIAKAKAMVG